MIPFENLNLCTLHLYLRDSIQVEPFSLIRKPAWLSQVQDILLGSIESRETQYRNLRQLGTLAGRLDLRQNTSRLCHFATQMTH